MCNLRVSPARATSPPWGHVNKGRLQGPAPRCSGGLGLGRGQAFIHVYFSKEPM